AIRFHSSFGKHGIESGTGLCTAGRSLVERVFRQAVRLTRIRTVMVDSKTVNNRLVLDHMKVDIAAGPGDLSSAVPVIGVSPDDEVALVVLAEIHQSIGSILPGIVLYFDPFPRNGIRQSGDTFPWAGPDLL